MWDRYYSAMCSYHATHAAQISQSRLRFSLGAVTHTRFRLPSSSRLAARMSKLIKATIIVMHARATARLISITMTAVAEYSATMSASNTQASLSFRIWGILDARLAFD
jgi:hypothetical protein